MHGGMRCAAALVLLAVAVLCVLLYAALRNLMCRPAAGVVLVRLALREVTNHQWHACYAHLMHAMHSLMGGLRLVHLLAVSRC
jgi:hypothetical protein